MVNKSSTHVEEGNTCVEQQSKHSPGAIPWRILPTIAFCQFACTSLWFAPNAVVSQITHFGSFEVGVLTSIVQAGFILGTLYISVSSLADKFRAAYVFALFGISGAGLNLICTVSKSFVVWVVVRLLIGICLAGIYPVGMKVASQWYKNGLGFRLGVLVGALTLGTAFPWLLRGVGGDRSELPVNTTLIIVSAVSFCGAVLLPMLSLPPEEPASNDEARFGLKGLIDIWKVKTFRAAAFGYFGHMWELYAFWTFLPVFIEAHNTIWLDVMPPVLNLELTTFLTIAVGSIGSLFAGFISLATHTSEIPGSAVSAFSALFVSMICCFLAPLYSFMNPLVFFVYLLIWGATVVADSGQFSSLCALYAPSGLVGTALTISTCIGFTISVVSIQLLIAVSSTSGVDPGKALLILAPGPVLGCLATLWQWKIFRVLRISKIFSENEADHDKHSSTLILEKDNLSLQEA